MYDSMASAVLLYMEHSIPSGDENAARIGVVAGLQQNSFD